MLLQGDMLILINGEANHRGKNKWKTPLKTTDPDKLAEEEGMSFGGVQKQDLGKILLGFA